MKTKQLTLVEFGKKLRAFLGDTHEGRELTVIDAADFYKLFKASGLSFEAWVKSVQSGVSKAIERKNAFSLIERQGRIPEPFKTTFIDARTREEAETLFRRDHKEEEAQIDEIQVNKFCAMVIWHSPKICTP